ncbi:MAG: DUF3574 domain-containing protein [Desulfuromonadaceae bacterium]|nr:DUF3574 domain-containing protein [Desulfuromonadaceae bacterium]
MQLITLILGLNDKDTKKQKVSTKKATRILFKKLEPLYNGATLTTQRGYYKHANNTVTYENSIKVEIVTDTNTHVKSLIQDLKTTFNQESIIYSEQPLISELV